LPNGHVGINFNKSRVSVIQRRVVELYTSKAKVYTVVMRIRDTTKMTISCSSKIKGLGRC
jgi:hypothetical protein